MIVTIDYFTKWVKAKPIRELKQIQMILFIKEVIIQSFGLPESINKDKGSMFIGQDVKRVAKDFGCKLLYSTPYYAQPNG